MRYRVVFKIVLPLIAIVAVALVALYYSQETSAVDPTFRYPPLHAGTGSPGAIVAQQPENPEFFALVKTDWPLLNIDEPRTAWEYVQRGMYKQDDLEDEDGAIEDYLHAEELLEEIAARTGDELLTHRMLLIHYRLGPIFLHRGLYEEAIHRFDIILEENPESQGANREIALAYEGIGHRQLAEGENPDVAFEHAYEHFEVEREIAPDSQINLYEFAKFLLDPEVHLEGVDQPAKALELYQAYLARAKYHCDNYPLRILQIARRVEELGGTVDGETLEACVAGSRVYKPS